MIPSIDPNEYEIAFSEHLLYQFRPPLFEVVHDIKIKGQYSQSHRQIDVAVRRTGDEKPFLVAEAKRHGRKVEIAYIEAFVTKLQDINAKIGVMVASSDYSEPGRRLAEAFNIELFVMPIETAIEMNWRPIARRIFPMDWAFHPEMAAGFYRLQKGDSSEDVTEAIEVLPFEEWEAFVQFALIHHQAEAVHFLWFIANHHHDDGWRYNAIQQLIAFHALDQVNLGLLRARESDPDILALLENAGYR